MDLGLMVFFFFKQKTAYEMRISDWSSDVCSSDLGYLRLHAVAALRPLRAVSQAPAHHSARRRRRSLSLGPLSRHRSRHNEAGAGGADVRQPVRSEERRVGTESVSTCRSRWSTYHQKNQQTHRICNRQKHSI